MGGREKLQYNIWLFAIWLAIDNDFLRGEVQVEILFSSKKAGLL